MSFEEWLQSRLTAHGFPVGIIDGDLGSKSIAALKAFQTSRKLEPAGKADAATVEALRASASAGPVRPLPDAPVAGAPAPIPIWPKQSGVPAFYGAVGTSQVRVELPFSMKLAWDLKVEVQRISLHSKVAASAERAFKQIAQEYNPSDRADLGLDIFGGSLNVRKMRGGSAYSMHSWGIAIDFDPERNTLYQTRCNRDTKGNPDAPARLSRADAEPFWRAWEEEGWVSLGRQVNYDWMHVQAARL